VSNKDKHPADVAEWANTTSTRLIEGAKNGEQDSWFRLVRLYAPLVLNWCRKGFPPRKKFPALSGVPERDAPDVVQEVFRTTAKKIKDFEKDGQPAAFRRWLYIVTGFKVLEYWRVSPHLPLDPEHLGWVPAPEGNSSSTDAVSERRILLRRILDLIRADFEPRTWEAFRQVAVEGRSAKDVAKELGMKVGAVYTVKSRGLKRLKEEARAHGLFPAGENVAANGAAVAQGEVTS
jgi:RNA polymerase sigma-70 factor (ECF subfamily)